MNLREIDLLPLVACTTEKQDKSFSLYSAATTQRFLLGMLLIAILFLAILCRMLMN